MSPATAGVVVCSENRGSGSIYVSPFEARTGFHGDTYSRRLRGRGRRGRSANIYSAFGGSVGASGGGWDSVYGARVSACETGAGG